MPHIILVILIILLFPIPINLKLNYENKKIKFFIYNKELSLKQNKNKPNLFKPNNITKNIHLKSLIELSKKFSLNVFIKPKLKINYTIAYDTQDAANTAIAYGILNILPYYIYKTLNLFFKINKYNYTIVPMFNNKKFLNFQLKCIINLNIIKIIYITYIFIKFSISKRRNINGK